jgi:hypothetical protein
MVVQLGLLVLSVGLSLAAAYLLAPKGEKSIARDDKPTTLVKRGAFVPYVIGRRRIGALFAWAGDRFVRNERVGSGGKGVGGGKSQKQPIYYESAWHLLCVGPAFKLHKVYLDGAVIFDGPIDSQSHPSGSTIDLGKQGSFQIYWGQYNQASNTYLGAGTRVGITSRWPFLCYIVWRDKRLGPQAHWPLIDYEIETRIMDVTRTASGSPWIEATRTLYGSTFAITEVTNGVPGTARLRIDGRHTDVFFAGGYLKIAGNVASANGDYRIHSVTHIPGVLVLDPEFTDIFLDNTLTGATVSGTVEPYVIGDDDGINPAHAAGYLLFGRYPGGLEFDPADFDLQSLDDLAAICASEKIPVAVIAQEGEKASAILASLMQDVGFAIPWDPTKGKYIFRAIRKEASATAIDQDVLLPPLPEIEINHAERPVDKMIFAFPDRSRNFRDMTLTVDDDGQQDLLNEQRPREIQMPNVISFSVANRVAERRFQEELAAGSVIKFTMNRASRLLIPGHVISVPGYSGSYRVERTEIDPLSGKVVVHALEDLFGAAVSAFAAAPGGGAPPPTAEPLRDLAFTFTEVPSHISPGVQQIAVPRVRATDRIVGADIWLSRDGTTYSHVDEDTTIYTGGTLNAELNAATFTLVTTGPVITALGPDITTALDLSGDVASWRGGRQLAIIDEEIFYVQKLTSLGGSQYRLDGLIRARFDTPKVTHAAGAKVFILTNEALLIEDILLVPNAALYVKPQPKTSASLPLSMCPAATKTLIGKGVAPMRMENLRTANASNHFNTGQDIPIKWTYRSVNTPRTGAGLQLSGSPVGTSSPEGVFTIRFKDMSDVVKREVTVSTPSYTYTNGLMVSDFGSEPSSLKVNVENVNSGLKSPAMEITVVKI